MYKIIHHLIATPISDFLIPLERPSRHYHPSSYRMITATTDYYNFSFFPRAVFNSNNLLLETVAGPPLEQFNQAVCKIDHIPSQKITILLLLNLTCILTYLKIFKVLAYWLHPLPLQGFDINGRQIDCWFLCNE